MRIVIKVGTSTLAHGTGQLNLRRIEQLCKVIADIKNSGVEVIMVSSGAIGMGVGKLSLPQRPQDVPGKQAASAVGQCELMYIYDKEFEQYHHVVAQMLLTSYEIENIHCRQNIENTLQRLMDYGVLPIVNENDTVATEELGIGENDTLSAIVATLARADLLVILSDIDGLYDSDPHQNPDAKLIPRVEAITPEIFKLAGGTGSTLGTGGMETKLRAGLVANRAGIPMVILNGQRPELLYDLMDGKPVGTRFEGRKPE